ncbi:MAG: DUF29 domain-containing protein [Gemmatimonadaceae bacterium]|nr:DUF29 domain-containing protein [Acetobacteraceae bacterium]
MPDPYDTDILTWAEHQAALLRRLAAGERVNDAIDWPNVIEELETVGRSELKAVESLLIQAFVHLIKLQANPDSIDADHWADETDTFLANAKRAFTPSMRQRIDLDDLFADASGRVRRRLASPPVRPLPETCPYTLDDLLVPEPDIDALTARLSR